jgi:hypothetical protein
VEIELLPEPDAAAREAAFRAVAAVTRAEQLAAAGYGSDWRRAALAEGVERDPGYAPSPRSSRGATRT